MVTFVFTFEKIKEIIKKGEEKENN